LICKAELIEKETKQVAAICQASLFIRGIGGFGYKGTVKSVVPSAMPKRPADYTVEETTTPSQAILYRLNGDSNPLHVDPDMAEMGGFKQPILHGLCSFGISARAIQQHFFKANPDAMKRIACRFTSHVFPGETLVVSAWKEGSTILFATSTKERGLVVIQGAV
jgi:acyl dehydratase